jgi:hypothetical protein
VTWSSPVAWSSLTTDYQTPDIKTIVQEIVGQAGWDTGDKSMALYIGTFTGTALRKAYSFNGSAAYAPLLHIEYTPPVAGSGAAVIDLGGSNLIGQTCTQGLTAESKTFKLTNSGAGTLNYTVATTYTNGSGWLSLSPFAASGTLGAGAERNFTIGFNSASLAPGLYQAAIKFTDPNASNSPQTIQVSLNVTAANTMQCDSLPMYTQNISNPAVLILLEHHPAVDRHHGHEKNRHCQGRAQGPDHGPEHRLGLRNLGQCRCLGRPG